MKRLFLILSAAVISAAPVFAQPKLSKNNIDEVLKAMTLEEKADLVIGNGWGSMMAGSMTASDATLVSGAAGTTKSNARLGIPQTVLADGPAGLRINPTRPGTDKTFYCTGFPIGTVLACSWNTEMVEELLASMGEEVREYGVDVLLAPGMNIHRNPLCGRNFEYFSEDPLLSGKMAAAYVRGIQSQGVGVSVKHFMGNNQEINRNENDSRISQRALREIYLKNFEIALRESEPWTVMSSYNKTNGQYTQQNHDLLTGILRDEWGYKGIVMTDWGAKEGTVKAVHAGNDLMEPGMPQEKQRIIDAVNDGTLDIADLDRNVRRMLEYIVKTPRFEGYKFSNNPDLKKHAEQVRKAAAEGMVLLKNDADALPMKGISKVALFGLSAYTTIAGGTGSGNVNKAYVRSIAEGLENAGFKLDEKVVRYYKAYRDYITSDDALADLIERGPFGGGGLNLGDAVIADGPVRKAVVDNTVASNDAAIIVIGRNAGEGDDRRVTNDFDLSDAERSLLTDACNAYHKAGKKVYVVLNIGGVIETASWKNLPDAILLAWTPGQEAGNSVADVLTGKSNPSGKLSMTFPVAYLDAPSSFNFPYEGNKKPAANPFAAMMGGRQQKTPVKDIDYTEYAEGIYVGYRYFTSAGKAVSYPFGYGLSYTTFEYSAPVAKLAADGSINVSVTVKNTGKVAGKEAVQVYVSAPSAGLEKPACELKAFAKTKELQPGQSQTLTMKIDAYSLASFNTELSRWETAAGKYSVKIASNVEDVRCKLDVQVKKAQNWPVENLMAPVNPVNDLSLR